ncbi:MAG: response regulator [Pseudomonadota bacterium]
MSGPDKTPNIADLIAPNVPYLRRFARALSGSQAIGDDFAAKALQAIIAGKVPVTDAQDARIALFGAFYTIWTESDQKAANDQTGAEAMAVARLSALTERSREALLLTTLEEFSSTDAARIMQIDAGEVERLVTVAQQEIAASTRGRILIIEDETIIAADIESIVMEMGHGVTGIARTEEAALEVYGKERPDLVLADIQLADGSSGIDAVRRITQDDPTVPVIFITAFPERLLTGKTHEPAFMITKPYSEEQVRSAVSQAMFFASTETLKAAE